MGTHKYLMNLRTFVLIIFLSVGVCHSTGFSVSPVVFEFAASDRADVMTVSSSVDQRKAFEIAVFMWTQVHGQDVLEPTEDFIVTPPAFNLAARESRTIRILRTEPAPVTGETRYRLVLKEIPLFENYVQRALNVSLTISVPIFVLPVQPVQPKFDISFARIGASDDYMLKLANRGDTHGKVLSAQPLRDGIPVGEPLTMPGYALPGNERVWQVKRSDLKGANALSLGLPYGVKQTLKLD